VERAEREAGIVAPLSEQLRARNADKNKLLASASFEEVLALLPDKTRERLLREACEAYIDSLEIELRGFFLDAEAFADLVRSKRLSDRAEIPFFADKLRRQFGPPPRPANH